MDNLRKVRCPHCKTINSVNIPIELVKHETITYRNLSPYKKSDKNIPKSIEITCTHCTKSFKINI